ncbi:eukaryotic translation initiation factor 3 subunit B-like [Nicotiana sylvestris]|uniref:eukaryotic translation initiation factor 3 subunit B-like n=1 Tax=Nicotiana sylvestris TaxID=4096 RepID=UPI00388C6600
MEEDPSEFDTGFGNILVVDNLPVVPKEKFEKLEGVVQKIYSQLGVIKEDGLWMPVDPETQKTLRYCFIEYNTPQEAELSKEKTHGYKLDMSHIFVVNMFDDIEKFLKVPDEWARPEIKPYVPRWLTDEKARDQFVIRACNDTEVLWNDARQLKPELVYKRSRTGSLDEEDEERGVYCWVLKTKGEGAGSHGRWSSGKKTIQHGKPWEGAWFGDGEEEEERGEGG